MDRIILCGFIAVVAVATPFRAWGEMSLSEAKALVERFAEGPVQALPAVTRGGMPPRPGGYFVEERPGVGRIVYQTNLDEGYLWVVSFPQPPPPNGGTPPERGAAADIAPEAWLDLAKALATRYLESDAATLAWRIESVNDREVTYSGVGPDVGDPPRASLAASCRATVLRREGRVLHYSQQPARHEPLLDPKVTREEAVAIARKATSTPQAPVRSDQTKLAQLRGVLDWYVAFDTESEPIAIIDAMTGEVKEASSAMSATSEASEDTEQGTPAIALQDSPAKPSLARTLAGPGAAVVLLAALAVVLRRRR